MDKFDKVLYGVIAGIILPIVGFFISFPIKKLPETTLDQYISMTLRHSENQQDILIFCLIPNMLLFYFTNFRWGLNEATKGLVGATLVLGIGLFLMVL